MKFNKKKTKKFFKAVGKGAKEVGSRVASGAGSIAKKGYEEFKKRQTPEYKEQALKQQVAIEKQKAELRKVRASNQPSQPSGGSFLGGFGGINMGSALGGGGGMGGGGIDFGGNFNNAMGAISGAPQKAVAVSQPRRYKTVRVRKIRYKSYKPQGARRSRRRRVVSYSKKRVRIGNRMPRQPAAFYPFSQF